MIDYMSRKFFIKIKLLLQKTVLKVSLFQYFISADSNNKSQKFKDLGKFSTLIHTEFSIFRVE